MKVKPNPKRILTVLLPLVALALAIPISSLAATPSPGPSYSALGAEADTGYVVVLKGSPAEIGRQYGQQAKPLIEGNVVLFQAAAKRAGLSQEELLAAGKEYEADLLGVAPGLIQELKAVAETSAVAYESLLAFNALGERLMGEGCTTLLATGKATQDGNALFQKNRDATRGYQAVLQVTPAVGYRYVAISNPGRLGVAMGVNEKGVSIGNNVLSTWDTQRGGLGNLTVNQFVLEQAASARQGVQLIQGWKRSGGSNYPVADLKEAAFVETTANATAVQWVVDTAMAHTNHYILPGMQQYDIHTRSQDQVWSWYISTETRLARANALLQPDLGKIDIHRMVAISEDQDGPSSVYWIDAQAVINDVAMGSVASAAFDGAKLRMWAQLGQPSIAPAVPFDVDRPLVPGPFNSGQQSERIDNTQQNVTR